MSKLRSKQKLKYKRFVSSPPSKYQKKIFLLELQKQVPVIRRSLEASDIPIGLRKNELNDMWNYITERCNAIGPTVKTVSSWKKYWEDIRRGFKIENQQIICAKHEEMPSGTCYICSDISINGLVTKIIRSIEQNTESSSYECMPTTSREANPSNTDSWINSWGNIGGVDSGDKKDYDAVEIKTEYIDEDECNEYNEDSDNFNEGHNELTESEIMNNHHQETSHNDGTEMDSSLMISSTFGNSDSNTGSSNYVEQEALNALPIKQHEDLSGGHNFEQTVLSGRNQPNTLPRRITAEQKELFIYLLEHNMSQLITGTNPAQIWKHISDRLNSMGPQKDIQEWKRCWCDIKSKTKEKRAKTRENVPLKELDERVLRLCDFDKNRGKFKPPMKNFMSQTPVKIESAPKQQVQHEQNDLTEPDNRSYKQLVLSSLRAQEESLKYLRTITEQNAIIIELLKTEKEPLIK